MAEKRMFSQKIIDSDAFFDMPLTAQALYFHLAMRADDDGFINNPRTIQRMLGSSEEDLKLLIAKRFLIAFEGGIVVIKHWKIHNNIRKDRYKPTQYQNLLELLEVKSNKSYTEKRNVSNPEPACNQSGSKMDPQYSIYKNRLGKIREEEISTNEVCTKKSDCQPNDNQTTTNRQPNDNQPVPQYSIDKIRLDKIREEEISIEGENEKFSPPSPTLLQIENYIKVNNLNVDAEKFYNYYNGKNWLTKNGNKFDWKKKLSEWHENETKSTQTKDSGNNPFLNLIKNNE